MRVSLVAAMDKHGVIGDERGMPWHLPSDLRRFKKLTWGKPIVMGRKTRELIGRNLPGRENVVLTRDPAWRAEGAHVVRDASEALALAKRLLAPGADEVVVIGGGEVYRLFLHLADRVYLTIVEGEHVGTATFPVAELAAMAWSVAEQEYVPADEKHAVGQRFFLLERIPHGTPADAILGQLGIFPPNRV